MRHSASQIRTRLFSVAAVVVAMVVLIVTVTAAVAVGASSGDRAAQSVDLEAFMTGLACHESHGNFNAYNPGSGAYGKYQILPLNWVAWAGRYLHNRWAQPTPRNQEFVARQRVADLYTLRGDWRRVAYWWFTGDGQPNETLWSPRAMAYVNRVMYLAELAASPRYADELPATCFPARLVAPTIRSQPFPRIWVTGGTVHVRILPGYEFRAMTVVRRGMSLPVLRRGLDPRGKLWLKIGLPGGRTGWIASWFTG